MLLGVVVETIVVVEAVLEPWFIMQAIDLLEELHTH